LRAERAPRARSPRTPLLARWVPAAAGRLRPCVGAGSGAGCSGRAAASARRQDHPNTQPPLTPQYREDEEQQQQQQQGQQQQEQQGGGAVPQQTLLLNPANIMFDRRVVRGSTYRPAMPQQMPNMSATAKSSSQ
jgi:hypothetical protein